jgi:hypothetical protein
MQLAQKGMVRGLTGLQRGLPSLSKEQGVRAKSEAASRSTSKSTIVRPTRRTSAAEAVPFPVKVKVRIKINVKGVGQECPTHTGKINVKIKSPPVSDENNRTGHC